MKKTLARIFSVALVLVMAVATLASCGGSAKNYAENNTEYFIGATGPLTGDASSYGISVNNGAKLAIKEINAKGGLNGKLFKYEMKDDQAIASFTASGYDALYEAGMQISIGAVTSGACESFASKAEENNLLFMTPSASTASVISDRSNGFRICFGDPDQGVLAARNIAAKYTKVGVIYDTSSDYSKGVYDAFAAEMNKLGKSFTAKTFDAENNKDFSAQVEALKDCDVIFLPIYYTEAGLIAKMAVSKGCNAVLFGCDGFDGIKDQITNKETGELEVSNKIMYITPFDANSTDPTVKSFVDAYKAEYNLLPDQFAADGYDAVYAIYNAMKAANVDNVTISPSELCDIVRAKLTESTFVFKGATGEVTWNEKGEPTKVPQIVEFN
ncbi:MAG: ABC transporter substrate-binding protein [Eubacteriales bacterium]